MKHLSALFNKNVEKIIWKILSDYTDYINKLAFKIYIPIHLFINSEEYRKVIKICDPNMIKYGWWKENLFL